MPYPKGVLFCGASLEGFVCRWLEKVLIGIPVRWQLVECLRLLKCLGLTKSIVVVQCRVVKGILDLKTER